MTAGTETGDPLGLLDDGLRERALTLRYLMRKPRDPQARLEVAELVCLSVDAAFAGDTAAAAACLDRAERIAAPWTAADTARRDVNVAAAAARAGRRARQDLASAVLGGLAGHVDVPGPGPLAAATDGSYRAPYYGWACITTAGQWELAARRFGSTAAPDGHQGALTAELRAAGLAAARVEGPAVVFLDSLAAISILETWQAGDVTRMPALRDGGQASAITLRRSATRQSALAEVAEAVAARPDLEFRHVRGHRGQLLNEAADMLAKMARRWLAAGPARPDRGTMTAKADDLAAAFLRSWHDPRRAAS